MLYRLLRLPVFLLAKALFGVRLKGQEHIPDSGPVVLAANHASYVDPIMVALMTKRPVHFMAKEELWQGPVLGRVVEALHAFPVRRGKRDMESMKNAIQILKEGEVLGLFPEGTRVQEATLGPGQPGVALVAVRGGAAIVPVGLSGTERIMPGGVRLPRFPRVTVTAGPALATSGYGTGRSDLHRLTREIMAAIGRLAGKEPQQADGS